MPSGHTQPHFNGHPPKDLASTVREKLPHEFCYRIVVFTHFTPHNGLCILLTNSLMPLMTSISISATSPLGPSSLDDAKHCTARAEKPLGAQENFSPALPSAQNLGLKLIKGTKLGTKSSCFPLY